MPAADPSLHRRAVAYLLLSDLYWAISFPLLKALAALNHRLVPAAGTWFLTAAALAPRFLLAALIVLLWWRRAAIPTAAEVRQGLLLSLFAFGGLIWQTDGLQFTAASTSSFLTQFTAVLIPAWLALRHRHFPGPAVWLAAGLVMAGAGILGHLDWRAFRLGRGESETLLCSLFFTGQIVCLNDRRYAGNRAEPLTLVLFTGQAVAFWALAAVTAPAGPVWGPMVRSVPWAGINLVVTVVCTIGATWIMNRWQPLVSATRAGIIYALEPAFAASFALFLPALLSRWAGLDYVNERATWAMLAGGGLIMLANVLVLVFPTEAGGAARAPAPGPA